MTVAEVRSKRTASDDDRQMPARSAPVFDPAPSRRAQLLRARSFLITLTTAAVAALLGCSMWNAYMGAPWTRDASVRAHVVLMAPEVCLAWTLSSLSQIAR